MKNKNYIKIFAILLSGVSILTSLPFVSYAAAEEQKTVKTTTVTNDPKEVVSVAEILQADAKGDWKEEKPVTRGEFAAILVRASLWKNKVSQYSNTTLFQDVKGKDKNSGYIKAAVNNKWMKGDITGRFYPGRVVTLEEAAISAAALLGYEDSDFAGKLSDAKFNWYQKSKLSDGIKKGRKSKLNRGDCILFFANLLRMPMKDGTLYGTKLGYPMTDQEEVDLAQMKKKDKKGPYVVDINKGVSLPFTPESGVFYRNGKKENVTFKDHDVYYYSKKFKTVWVYDEKIYGTYDGLKPDSTDPQQITISGTDYAVGNQTSILNGIHNNDLKEGSNVIIYTGENKEAAGIISQELIENEVTGVLLEKGEHLSKDKDEKDRLTGYIKVVDTAGRLHTYDCNQTLLVEGEVVKVSFADGEAVVKRMDNMPLVAKIDEKGSYINDIKIASDIKIMDIKGKAYKRIAPARIAGMEWTSNEVLYYQKNEQGEMASLLLNDVTGDLYEYGVLTDYKSQEVEEDIAGHNVTRRTASYSYLIGGNVYSAASERNQWDVNETGPKGFIRDGAEIKEIKELSYSRVDSIENNQVLAGGQTFRNLSNVLVYVKQYGDYYVSELERINNFNRYTITAYYDKYEKYGGRIRIVVAEPRQ